MRLNLRRHVSDVVFIAVVLILLARFISITEVKPMPVSVVLSGSMEPTLSKGDVVFWAPCRIADISPGDIIVYKSYIQKDVYVLHRVVEIREENGETLLVTKGDANEYTDQSGPHVVEPYIRENHLVGKVVGIGGVPLKIPFLGHVFIALGSAGDFVSKSISSAGTPFAAVPLAIPAIAFVLLLIFWEDESAKKYKKINLILGPEKMRVRRVFMYTFIVFLVLMLATVFFAYSVVSVSVGVGQKTEPANLEVGISQNNSTSRDITVMNDGFLPMKCVIFMDGQAGEVGYVEQKTVMVNPGEHKNISVRFFAYSTTKPGTYNGNIVAYSSPFWSVLPDEFILALVNYNPHIGIFILDLVSSLIFAILVILIMFLLSILTDELLIWASYLKSRTDTGRQWVIFKNVRTALAAFAKKYFYFLIELDWLKIDLSKVLSRAMPLLIIFIPLAFINLVVSIIICTVLTTITLFYTGMRYRAQFYTGCLINGMLIMLSVYVIPGIFAIYNYTDVASLLSSIAAALLLYIVFLVPLVLISYLTAKLVYYLAEKKEPFMMFEGDV